MLIALCGTLLIGAIAAGTGALLLHLRDRALAESKTELRNLALVLAEQANRSFQAAELVQKNLIDRMQTREIDTGVKFEQQMSDHDTHLMLKDIISGLPQIDAVTMIGAQGKLINFSRYWPIPSVNVADRDYFKALKADPKRASFISEPVRNRGTGTWTIYMARQISAPDGAFVGLVLCAMELRYFEEFYRRVALGADGSISLIRRDGTLPVRHPEVTSIGQSFAANPVFPQLLAQANSAAVRMTSLLDGKDRLYAAHSLADYPIIVSVGTTMSAALANWRASAWYLTGAAVLIALVVAGAVFLTGHQIGRRLHAQHLQLDSALDNMSQGLCMFDAQQRLVICNSRYVQMYGLSPDDVKPGMAFREIIKRRLAAGVFEGPNPAEYEQQLVENRIVDQVTTGLDSADRNRDAAVTSTSRHVRKLNDGRIIEVVNHPLENGGWVATHEDITERRRAEEERDRSKAFLDLVIENIPVTVAVKDARDFRYVLINRAGENYYGIARERIIGKTAHEVLPADSATLVTRLDQQLLESHQPIYNEHIIEMPGQLTRIAMSTRLPIFDESGEVQYLLAVVDDITERKRAEQRIAHMAQHDMLTGLANRTLFCEELNRALAHVQRGERIAVLYLDLDHFKRVNDTLGHVVGDELLRQAAERLHGCLRETDALARLGGDEFAILQTALEQPADAAALAVRIGEALSKPFDLSGHQVSVGVSIGISIAPDDTLDREQLLTNADLALYGAKDNGRGTYHFYEPNLDARMKARQKLESDLRNALAGGQFELYYQPIVNLQTNAIVGCEALLRWHHPERGMVSPAEFIPVAEESGLIGAIGEWVLRQACADAAAWPLDIHVAVNLSPTQLKGGGLLQVVVGALAAFGLSARRLELEITESVLMQNTEMTLRTLHQLRDLGVRISLDDFGTGYSSLSYLRSFPFDKIKIDRSFVENISEKDDCVAIVQAVATMAQRLGMTTVAEGIETDDQRDKVRELGCTEMQGYLFSRPRPVEEIVRRFPVQAARAASAA